MNKFVYTKAQSRVIGQEQLSPKIMKKSEVISDQPTDVVNYRVALMGLKTPLSLRLQKNVNFLG